MLSLIWQVALTIAAAAFTVMLGLILVRFVSDRLGRRRQALRDALLERILLWLDRQIGDAEIEALLNRHRGITRRLLVEIFELMRGEDQVRLADLAARNGVPGHLRGRLARGRYHQRLSAAESLVWFPGPETTGALVRALDDRSDEVALAAAASLADFGENLPLARLLQVRLGQSGESSRRLEAVLMRVAQRQMGDLMRLATDPAVSDRVRAAAVDALARTSSFTLIEPLSALAGDPAGLVRAAVARGLGVLGHPDGAATVRALLADGSWEVRAEAAEAAGRIGSGDLVPALARLLEDETWWVRFRAGEALVVIGEDGLAALRAAAASSLDLPRRMAGLILAERELPA